MTPAPRLPHAAPLADLLLPADEALDRRREAHAWPVWELTPRQLCDVELLLNGGFSPLRGFLGRADYDSVVMRSRLAGGALWPIPVVLDVPDAVAGKLAPGSRLGLQDPEGALLAVLHVEDLWQPDLPSEAGAVYGTTDRDHPGVAHVLERTHPWYVGGRLEGIQAPAHHDFLALRRTPRELQARFEALGWSRVVAFQTRNPMHRAHYELTLRAARQVDAKLLIHPVVGQTKPGDVDHYTRVRCYQALLRSYPAGLAELSLLPLAMRMAGPREAVWHAIIRKNYGCSHLIVGRDHAGPGADSAGKPFYAPYAAQEALEEHAAELGIQPVPFPNMVYLGESRRYVPQTEVPPGEVPTELSGTQLRKLLQDGAELPDWFTFPEVVTELRRRYPPRVAQGFTVFFTGLSGSGKSTIAQVLLAKLLERGERSVTLLDGDLVRKNLSSELGFSKEHRDLNIRRIGFVAAEVTKAGGVAVCAPIAPYDAVRKDVRQLVGPHGGFLLVHVATPLSVCEERDRKGLYAQARAGKLKGFTGISDPYEPPGDAEIVLDTTDLTPEACANAILSRLESDGFLGPVPSRPAE